MTALESLQPRQFMSVKRMGRLQSGDFDGLSMAEVGQMKHMSPSPEMTVAGMNQRDMINSVSQQGVIKPIKVNNFDGKAMVTNGHHRYNAAVQSGQTHVPVEYLHWNTRRDAANTAGHYTMKKDVGK
jgi:hypothetical protein